MTILKEYKICFKSLDKPDEIVTLFLYPEMMEGLRLLPYKYFRDIIIKLAGEQKQ